MTGISKKIKGFPVKPGTAKKDAAKMFHELFLRFLKTQKGKTFKSPGSSRNNPFCVKTFSNGVMIIHLGQTKTRQQLKIFRDRQSIYRLFEKFAKKGTFKPGDFVLDETNAFLLPVFQAFFKLPAFQSLAMSLRTKSPATGLGFPRIRRLKSPDKKFMKQFTRGLGPGSLFKRFSYDMSEINLIDGVKSSQPPAIDKSWDIPVGKDSERILYEAFRGHDEEYKEKIKEKIKEMVLEETGEETIEEEKDPPRSSYALLECDENVVMNRPFTLHVGLSKLPGKNNIPGEELERPEFSRGPYDLDIQLLAPGFSMVKGNWKFTKRVTAEKPYPVEEIRLKAEALGQDEPFQARYIRAIYSTEGHTMGSLLIAVVVLRQTGVEGRPADEKPPPETVVLPRNQEAADLTVHITRGIRDRDLVWTFDSPHENLKKLAEGEPPVTDIGKESREFAKGLIDKVELNSNKPRKLYRYLLGKGKQIFDKTPDLFQLMLAEMKKLGLADPTLLILSQDPYIPWELMVLPEEIQYTRDASPFLSAQLRVGRWLFKSREKEPPARLTGRNMLVIAGTYDSPSFDNLEYALKEADELHKTYKAEQVEASEQKIMDCLENRPPGNILHFAVHGKYAPGSVDEGIVTIDEQSVDSATIRGHEPLPLKPFVFLNACQVGSGSEMLGDYAGIAAAFLYIGASGVLAPLWSVNDEKAKEIALGFYQDAFTGTSPSEILKKRRAGFSQATADATSVAYIYFGHPAMNMARK